MDGLGVVYEQEEPLVDAGLSGAAGDVAGGGGAPERSGDAPEDDEELRALAQDPDAALGSADAHQPQDHQHNQQQHEAPTHHEQPQQQEQQPYGGYSDYGAQQAHSGQYNDASKPPSKLFIGGVAWETTEDTLRAYFSKYGALTDAALMKDKFTGQPRGFGFVTFADPSGTLVALLLADDLVLEANRAHRGVLTPTSALDRVLDESHTLDGRSIEVKRAIPRDRTPAGHRLVLLAWLGLRAMGERKEEHLEREARTRRKAENRRTRRASRVGGVQPSCVAASGKSQHEAPSFPRAARLPSSPATCANVA
jgi:hypothetical protein